jgi:hypothetical protein
LRGQVEDFDNLNLDTKAGERIKGELYKGKIEIIGDYFSHKTIKSKNKDAADIIIVNSIEEAKAQFDAYKVDELSSFTDIEQYPERTVNAFEVDYDQAFLLDNLRILRQATDNWEKVIKYYADKSAYNVMTRKVRIQETDPENDTTDEEAQVDPTKSQKFDKGADVNLLEIADKEVVYILKSLFAASRNERGALVYEKNRLGYKKLANYKKVWNAIVRATNGTKDPRLMYQRIVQAASNYPELQQLIESRLPNPQLVGQANTTGNVMRSFGITTSFWSVFSLPRVPYMQLTVFRNQYETFDWKGKPRISRSETEGLEVTNASTDIGNTIRKFEAHFAARLDSKFTKRDQDNVTVLNLDQVIQDFSDRSGNFKNGTEFQFLNAIGFNLDDLKKIKDELSDPNNLKRFGIEFIFRTIKDLNDANKAGSMSDAARRVYNNFIKNPISGLKKGIEPGVIGLRDSFLLKEGSKQSTQVDRIITLQNRYGSTASTFSVQNPEKNRVNEHVSDSTLTVIADGINNPGIGVIDINQEAKQTDMYRFGTTTEHLDPAVNPFADSSIALKSMFMPDKTKRQGRSISVEMNAGTQTINTIISENGSLREGAVTGSNTTSLDKRGKFIQDIHTFLKTGRIELMRPGSKGSSFGWRLDGGIVTSAITKKDQHLYADIDSFLPNTAGEADVIEGIILPYLSSEVKRINIYNNTPEAKNYVGYNREFVDGKTFGQSFVYFDGILSKNLQNEILEKVKDPGVKLLDYLKTDPELAKRIKAEIKAYFTTKTNELYNYLSKAKFVDKSLMDRLKLDNLNTEQKERVLMRAFMYNYWIHNVETSILFLGDIAQFDHKKQELHKRISGLISNGPRIRTDIDAQTFSKVLGETSYAASEDITPIIYKGYAHTAIMKEVKRDSIYADTIRRGLTKDYERRYRTRNIPNKEALIKERIEKEVEKYTKAEIKEADGQGYITFDAYRLFKTLQNKWSVAQENLYQRILAKEDISATEIIEMFPVYKLQNFGFVQGTVLPVTAMHKFALMPLIPSMIKGTDFEVLHRQMMEQGVHYATFESGSKIGHVTSNGKEADDVFEDADQTIVKPNIKFTVNSINAGFLKEAASVNSKFKGEVVFSTQLRKLILSGLYEQGKLINDAYAPIVNKYEDTVDFYTELLKYDLLNEIEYNTDGKNLVGKPDKFLKLIRENLERKDYPEHLLRQLQTNVDGTLKGDLSYFIDRKTIEKTILSIVEKRFVRQYVNGEPLVQVASTFSNGLITGGPRFQKPTAAERKKFLGTNNFPFYDVETVDLAAQFKGLSKEELKAELRGRKAVSYPTPAKAYILKNEIEYLEDVIAGKKPSQTTYDKPTSAMKIGIALQGDFVNLLNLKHIDGKPIETRARLNEMIKNEEWLDTDDNRQKITLTAVRIPVQGYNSMEFMEVYEFLDPAASNLIMLPTEIVAKSGGDFDVDKLTTFFPNIDKNGNLYKAPVDNKDFIAEANKIKDKEARKKFIQQQKLATQNQFISSIRSILELPESYASLIRPNDTYILKDLADRLKDDVSDYDKFTKHNGEVNMSGDKKVLSPTTTLEPLFNYSKHEENHVGKAVLGIGASENALSPLFDAAGGKMPLTYKATKYVNGKYVVDTDNPADYKMRLDLRHNKIGDQISLSDLYSADGVDKISDVYSQAMNGWVDIEKDEWIFYIQGNYEIAPTFLYLIKAGVPVKDAVYFVSQPMIREFAEQQRLIGGDYGAILGVAPSASQFTRFQSARDIVNKYTAKYLYAIMGNPLILPTDKFNVEFRPVDNYTEEAKPMMLNVTKAELSRKIAAGNINPLEIMRIYKIRDKEIDLYLAPDLRNTQYYNAAVFASSKADRVDGNFSVDTMERIIDSKKSVNDLSPQEIITEMAMFLHFYEIQKQLMGLSAMKRAGKSDTKTYGNFQEIYLAEVDVDALAENTKIDQEFKRRFLDESVVASLKDKSIITDVAAPMLDLVNNNITNRAIKNIIANRDISSFGVGTDGVIKFIDVYKDAIVTFLYQNYLSNSIDAKGNIISVPQEYRSEKVSNNKALESDVIYTQNGFTINLENIKRDYRTKVYLANSDANTAYKNREGLKPFNVSEDPFDNEEQYIRYVLERAFQKSKGLTGLQLNQVALMNVYNPNALSKNSEYSYTKMVLDLIDEFPALKTEYPVLEQLSARATKDFYLLTLNDRDAIDGSTKSQYAANIRALGNPRIQKVKGDANNRISAIFSLLPKIAVYQHGHGITPFGLEQVVPQETVLSATTDAGNLFKLNYWNADVLDLIFKKLTSQENNRRIFKNFLVTPTEITSPSNVTVTPEPTVDPESVPPSTPIERSENPFVLSKIQQKVYHVDKRRGLNEETLVDDLTLVNPSGVFFTTEKQYAEAYAKDIDGVIYEAYVDVQNPIVTEDKQYIERMGRKPDELPSSADSVIHQSNNPNADKYGAVGTEIVVYKPEQIKLVSNITQVPTQLEGNTILNKIEELFRLRPELAAIGTPQQYTEYINTIFPGSAVKDILYHGTYEFFEEFIKDKRGSNTGSGTMTDKKRGETFNTDSENAFFFTDNIDTALNYSFLGRYNYVEGIRGALNRIVLKSSDAQEAVNFLKTIPFFDNLIKKAKADGKTNAEILDILRDVNKNIYRKIDTMDVPGFVNSAVNAKQSIEQFTVFLENVDKFKSNDPTIKTRFGDFNSTNASNSSGKYNIYYEKDRGYLFVQSGNAKQNTPIKRALSSELSVEEITEFFKSAIEADKKVLANRAEEIKKKGYIENYMPVLVDIKNPLVHDYENSPFPDTYKDTKYPTQYIAARQVAKAIKEGNDAVVYQNMRDPILATSYGIFEPEQIHILGSTKDLKQFGDFINGKSTTEPVVKELPSIPMMQESIDGIINGTKVITGRTAKLENGNYIMPNGGIVKVTYLGEATVEPKTGTVTITNSETGMVVTRTLDQFAKAEGYKDAADFKKRSILSASLISGKRSRFIYQIEPVNNITAVREAAPGAPVTGQLSPETNPEITEFNTYLAENNNVFPKEFNASNGRRYLLNDNNLYDLVSPDGKTMYLRNINLKTGQVESVLEPTVQVTRERKIQAIKDINDMIVFMSLDLKMAEDGYNVYQMMEDINNATTMNQIEKIEEIIRKYTC